MRKDRDAYNEYMRAYLKRRYSKRRAEAKRRLGGKCARCGSRRNLEFDHIDPKSKKLEIASQWSAAEERFWKEIEKCQLLCRTCHTRKSIEDAGRSPGRESHGTWGAIRYCKPPCRACRDFRNAYQNDRRKRFGRSDYGRGSSNG